jgi:short-subunit dehydrogenase
MKQIIWLITGISSGLGKALSEKVMSNGDFVIGTVRSQHQLEKFNQTYAGNGKAFLLDITDEKAVQNLLKQIQNEFERIDVLVNNAGIGFAGAIEETSIQETRHVFESNFFGAVNMTTAVLPLMRKQRKGHIIQISSHGGIKAFAGFGIYNASKFAIEGYSEALAQEIKPLGIHTTIVEPGPFRTNFAGDSLQMASNKIDDYQETAGVFRSKLKGVHGLQEGDPVKAAQAILDITRNEDPPLRLPLGKTALLTIQMKLDSVREDLEKGKQIAESAVFD